MSSNIATDTLTYWRNALEGKFGPVHENDPQPGWYRTRGSRERRAAAVEIFVDVDGSLRAVRDGVPVDPCAVWTWVCMNPVPHEDYLAVVERGEAWPDEVPLVQWGHNAMSADPAELLEAEIALLWSEASVWLAEIGDAASKVQADRCANFADRFSALEKMAEDGRALEKRPVLEEGRAIDARWKPVVSAACDAKRAMKKALEPWLIAETEKRERASGFGDVPDSVRAGSSGRRISLRRSRRVHVSDRNAFIAHYRRDARLFEDEAVQKLLLKLAEIDLAGGAKLRERSLWRNASPPEAKARFGPRLGRDEEHPERRRRNLFPLNLRQASAPGFPDFSVSFCSDEPFAGSCGGTQRSDHELRTRLTGEHPFARTPPPCPRSRHG